MYADLNLEVHQPDFTTPTRHKTKQHKHQSIALHHEASAFALHWCMHQTTMVRGDQVISAAPRGDGCSPTWGHGPARRNPYLGEARCACNPNRAPPPPVPGLPYILHRWQPPPERWRRVLYLYAGVTIWARHLGGIGPGPRARAQPGRVPTLRAPGRPRGPFALRPRDPLDRPGQKWGAIFSQCPT